MPAFSLRIACSARVVRLVFAAAMDCSSRASNSSKVIPCPAASASAASFNASDQVRRTGVPCASCSTAARRIIANTCAALSELPAIWPPMPNTHSPWRRTMPASKWPCWSRNSACGSIGTPPSFRMPVLAVLRFLASRPILELMDMRSLAVIGGKENLREERLPAPKAGWAIPPRPLRTESPAAACRHCAPSARTSSPARSATRCPRPGTADRG